MNKAALGILIVLFSILFIVWWPFAAIWSINTLFRTDIPMNFRTWLAVVSLVAMFRISLLKKGE